MKAKEVLKTLRVTRNTLHTYVKQGKIRVVKYPNGRYEYNQEDVWKIAGIERNHLNVMRMKIFLVVFPISMN